MELLQIIFFSYFYVLAISLNEFVSSFSIVFYKSQFPTYFPSIANLSLSPSLSLSLSLSLSIIYIYIRIYIYIYIYIYLPYYIIYSMYEKNLIAHNVIIKISEEYYHRRVAKALRL